MRLSGKQTCALTGESYLYANLLAVRSVIQDPSRDKFHPACLCLR